MTFFMTHTPIRWFSTKSTLTLTDTKRLLNFRLLSERVKERIETHPKEWVKIFYNNIYK